MADAEVTLSSGRYDERSFVTDAAGRFEGWMRQPDGVVYVDVVTGSPPVQRSLTVQPETVAATRLKIRVELGGASLRVRAVLPDRQPVAGATVQVHQPGGSLEGMLAVTAQDGMVEFDGLDAGRYRVMATSREHGPSDRVEVDLTEATVTDVDLVLHGSRTLTVRVEAFEGTPIAGAEVSLYTDDGFDRRVTDAAGYATLRVSRRSAQAVVHVAARSHMLWAGCIRVGPDDVMAVRLPPTMPGTLRLEVVTRRAPGRTLLLLTGDAGFHTLGALTSWRRALGLPIAPETTIEVPRVAPGLYRLAWAPGPETAGLVTAVCTGALSAIGGVELAPDRVLTLTAPPWR